MRCTLMLTVGAVLLSAGSLSFAARHKHKAMTDPKAADADFAFQGEYVGTVNAEGERQTWGVQVIALGGGKFHAVGYRGGLPGAGWDEQQREEADGAAGGDAVVIDAADVSLRIHAAAVTVTDYSGEKLGTLKKIVRKSPTLGAKPPTGAVVLFDGTTADNFRGGRLTKDGLLKQGVTSKQKFGSCKCHLEFRLPYMPTARGQARGNSGCYVQGRYEVQMLDSFGLAGKDNECGGIYHVAAPRINMCLPPLSWQTYDIDFTAAVFQGDKKTKNARITVRHNGVVIHDNLELPGCTPGNLIPEGPGPGPVYLQNHGNPVRYRNIWVVKQ